ncbi:Glyoxalase/Bleomycin resistance protein/Dihydroxybiphenyl dioxygenase [Zopfia rhizophila CBS 207.26]|uniref:Glyoxalase/Bleomycin resistance protein/Dihydroxybiphenyl dioxygenase n=1 Tax=Zopfia rhizophila CBS 207.26 TaxID=1314779 RepID=A0A6A6DP98_9PEZI|nr:Glyoxalase/Bleomycin resistance protein/Dihydroxybiphenyl dioxygenase [Zopfia rhizophila CBS 207.26]
MSQSQLPPISHVLETCLYVRDVSESAKFYKSVFGREPFQVTPRIAGFALGQTTLLLFQLGLTAEDFVFESGTIPGHGPTEPLLSRLLDKSGDDFAADTAKPSLKQHFCFAVSDPSHIDVWETHLRDLNVKILGLVQWERGGKSVYFADPDGHVGEVGSRGIWAHY